MSYAFNLHSVKVHLDYLQPQSQEIKFNILSYNLWQRLLQQKAISCNYKFCQFYYLIAIMCSHNTTGSLFRGILCGRILLLENSESRCSKMESQVIMVWDNSKSKENEKFVLWHIQWMCISCKYVHVMYSHNPITHKTESQFGIKLIRQKYDKLDILRIHLFTMV